jgi:hypothetical protein
MGFFDGLMEEEVFSSSSTFLDDDDDDDVLLFLYMTPSIVCVFPDPVCPYAKIVALYPCNT